MTPVSSPRRSPTTPQDRTPSSATPNRRETLQSIIFSTRLHPSLSLCVSLSQIAACQEEVRIGKFSQMLSSTGRFQRGGPLLPLFQLLVSDSLSHSLAGSLAQYSTPPGCLSNSQPISVCDNINSCQRPRQLRLSRKPKHLYSLILLIVIPHTHAHTLLCSLSLTLV